MKTCFKCGNTKPLGDFYRHPQMADGHLGKCKTCAIQDARDRYHIKVNDMEWVWEERARNRDKYRRLYGTWNHDANAARAAQRRWTRNNRHKRHAQAVLAYALRRARIAKPKTCQRCGAEPSHRDLHGHHHDYSKPLDVEWICSGCHGVEHRAARPVLTIGA